MIDWNKAFPVLSITRNDLKEAGLTDTEIKVLTDRDMEVIASKVEDMLDEEELEESLRTATRMRIEFGELYSAPTGETS